MLELDIRHGEPVIGLEEVDETSPKLRKYGQHLRASRRPRSSIRSAGAGPGARAYPTSHAHVKHARSDTISATTPSSSDNRLSTDLAAGSQQQQQPRTASQKAQASAAKRPKRAVSGTTPLARSDRHHNNANIQHFGEVGAKVTGSAFKQSSPRHAAASASARAGASAGVGASGGRGRRRVAEWRSQRQQGFPSRF